MDWSKFSEPTARWFQDAFAEPTPVQVEAWTAISAGQHALVVAPTGSGKTLSAFLWSLDQLASSPPPAEKKSRCRILYISPLKALGVDVERNLRSPLVGIRQTAQRLGLPEPDIQVGVRSGDTSAQDRRRLVASPPDILITTPESLFLMLTSAAKEALAGVQTVIIDEIHAVAGTKRGAHLAFSLARLDALLAAPAQRIGLSATVRPLDEVARYLAGASPVTVVAPPAQKSWDLRVTVPVEDMSDLAVSRAATEDPDFEGSAAAGDRGNSIWPAVEEEVVDLIAAHRSTIVFTNSRRLSERLTSRLNEIAQERLDGADDVTLAHLPAQFTGSASVASGAPPRLAMAHHGSVSKEQRALIEHDLKRGALPCVVATSSLELGIDMGAVDLVVQIEAPPSVASGLQRVGRAGHQVGEVSRGVLIPKHRADLMHCAVTIERMREGAIESLRITRNPLDVLAQQLVATVATQDWQADDLYTLARSTAPFAELPRSAFDATLDLLSGRYPSDEFAELRPRVVWDRVSGAVKGRPGAQRLAVTSGGTIPDRGLFGVFLVGEKASRVGELDEEMVYESRVGDVFALGATSWRIEDITHDRVLVTPAPGQPGRLPFWKGDQLGRPYELGAALGAFTREIAALSTEKAQARLSDVGLGASAATNLVTFLTEQREATRVVPDDLHLLVERFRDELGDWRLVLHSPYGAQVHAPWALAIGARLRERFGVEAQALSADDGIVLRVPDSDQEPPGPELFAFEPDEIESIVTTEVGGSALFASRFRECAARALLLPRRDPGRRSPLWQQRQRAAQLLQVAVKYPSFPIVLEAVRECLQDVYDVPALVTLMQRIRRREVTFAEVVTTSPSPFARSLLFGYVAAFMYEGDNPIAERRAAALSLDQGLLAELLGRAELRELLDPEVLAQLELELQRLVPDRQARDQEGVADLLRLLGPLTTTEVAARSLADPGPWLTELVSSRRITELRVAGETHWVAIEDVGRLRDALGVAVPPGTPEAFAESLPDPLGDLVSRYARTHGPFTVEDVARRFGLGTAVVSQALRRLAGEHRVVQGEFLPTGNATEWCDAEVLRRLRRRSLAALRKEVEPVETAAFGRFLPVWQNVGSKLRGADGVLAVVEQLAGYPVPASAWESWILPTRLRNYQPADLDELLASGEVVWSGQGVIGKGDGWVSLHPSDLAPLSLPLPATLALSERHQSLLDVLANGGGYFFRQLGEPGHEDASLQALWELTWAGLVSNDSWAPLRALVGSHKSAHRARRNNPRVRMRPQLTSSALRSAANTPPTVVGRWALLPVPEIEATRRAHAHAESFLERYGVVTRGSVTNENHPGGFAASYRVLSAFEEQGRCRRGYFVDTLGAAQFATPGAVDRLRSLGDVSGRPANEAKVHALAATDPANPYGAALPWPAVEGHRPGRKAGAVVVLVDGHLRLYLERGGRTLLTFSEDVEILTLAARELAEHAARGALGRVKVERADGEFLLGNAETPLRQALAAAGFLTTPSGLRLRSPH